MSQRPAAIMFLLISSALGLFHRCPPREMVPECTCQHDLTGNNIIVTCIPTDGEFLTQKIKEFRPYVIDSLTIRKADIKEVKKGVFSKLSIHKLTIADSKIQYFDLFNGLLGIQETLEQLVIENCNVKEWWWTNGRGFVHLETLVIANTSIGDILRTNVVEHMPTRNLRVLEIVNCALKEVEDKAFKSLNRLKKLNLDGNHLTFLKRSHLPRPAKHLTEYLLSNNPIKELADDMFLDMPRLEKLSLSNASLEKLLLQIFNPVWDQLEEVYLNGNPLKCDCEAAWFLSEGTPAIFEEPTCHSPANLKGRKVSSLKRLEMVCL